MGAAGSTQSPAGDKYSPENKNEISEKMVENNDANIIEEPIHVSAKLKRNGPNCKPTDMSAEPKTGQKKRRKSFEDNMKAFNEITSSVDPSERDQELKYDSKRIMVENFMEQQVHAVSRKVVSLSPSLSQSVLDIEASDTHPHVNKNNALLSKSLKTGNILPSTNSSLTLRGMAKRHHARQHNAYMNSNSLVQVSSFLNSFSNKPIHDSGESLMSKKSSMGSKGSHHNLDPHSTRKKSTMIVLLLRKVFLVLPCPPL